MSFKNNSFSLPVDVSKNRCHISDLRQRPLYLNFNKVSVSCFSENWFCLICVQQRKENCIFYESSHEKKFTAIFREAKYPWNIEKKNEKEQDGGLFLKSKLQSKRLQKPKPLSSLTDMRTKIDLMDQSNSRVLFAASDKGICPSCARQLQRWYFDIFIFACSGK